MLYSESYLPNIKRVLCGMYDICFQASLVKWDLLDLPDPLVHQVNQDDQALRESLAGRVNLADRDPLVSHCTYMMK